MPDEAGSEHSESSSGVAPESDNSPSSRSWIKDFSAAVGVIAAVVGIWISVVNLRMKAEADEKTAEINRQTLQEKADSDKKTADIALKAEDIKLKIAEEEFRQHRQDSDDLKIKDQNASVATAIDHMFDPAGRSEGNLAVLFRYSQEDPALRELIINAIVVRVSEPRSLGEIQLGLRLLNHIGTPALTGLIEIKPQRAGFL